MCTILNLQKHFQQHILFFTYVTTVPSSCERDYFISVPIYVYVDITYICYRPNPVNYITNDPNVSKEILISWLFTLYYIIL